MLCGAPTKQAGTPERLKICGGKNGCTESPRVMQLRFVFVDTYTAEAAAHKRQRKHQSSDLTPISFYRREKNPFSAEKNFPGTRVYIAHSELIATCLTWIGLSN